MLVEDSVRYQYTVLDAGMSATPSGAFNSTECWMGTEIQVGSWIISKPNLIPTCILAAIIGIYCGHKIKKTGVQGSSPYSISFFMFACMMTDAMLWNCFIGGYHNWSLFGIITGIIDGGLTSCVGMSFGFNALFDMGLMKDGMKSASIMSVSYLSMIGAWVYFTIFTQSWTSTFLWLYGGVILFCCGLYSIVTLVHVVRSGGIGLKYILLGTLSGAIGLASIFYSPLSMFWCNNFGLYFNGEWAWFILSDVAMFALYKYFMASHVPSTKMHVHHHDDIEADDESEDESGDEVPMLIQPRRVVRQVPHLHPHPHPQQQPVYYVPVPYYSTTPTSYYTPQLTYVYQN